MHAVTLLSMRVLELQFGVFPSSIVQMLHSALSNKVCRNILQQRKRNSTATLIQTTEVYIGFKCGHGKHKH